MNFSPGNLYHIYNQGNNKQLLFNCGEDYITFLQMVERLIIPHAEIIAYCLMPNHFHFMLYTDYRSAETIKQGSVEMSILSNAFRKLLSGYARIFNERYGRSGSLFRQKTKNKLLTENLIVAYDGTAVPNYPSGCFNYIHNNPVAAGLVSYSEQWIYSSYSHYKGIREETLCNKIIADQYNLHV